MMVTPRKEDIVTERQHDQVVESMPGAGWPKWMAMTQALSGGVGKLHIKEGQKTDFHQRPWEAARMRLTSPTSSALSEGACE